MSGADTPESYAYDIKLQKNQTSMTEQVLEVVNKKSTNR